LESEKIIEINSLTKDFKDLRAVNSLNLSVYKGDVFGFLGPNGAGKSTTIRMLLSLIKPTDGSIKIFNKSLENNRIEILRRVGAIVEKPDFYGYLSAYKNLEILGLEKRFKSKVKTFSHGMKQRLGLAQTLLHDPDLIILDEPTTGLDPQGMKEIRELIIHLSKERGKTVFLSTHILSEIELVANRMIIINKGTTKVEGFVKDLLNSKKIKVSFEVNNQELTKNLLSSSGWSDKFDSSSENTFIFILENDEISELIKYLIENEIKVSAVIPTRSLEDYFLKITEEAA
jgi:ABC-type multidrug transport system ATPase subunit